LLKDYNQGSIKCLKTYKKGITKLGYSTDFQ